MSAGAAAFLVLTAIRRSGFGVEEGETSRYVYVTIALLLPVLAMALDAVLPRTSIRPLFAAGLAGLLLLVQIPLLSDGASQWASLEQPFKRRILATAQLIREGEPILQPIPVPVYIETLTAEKIAALDRHGDLPESPHPTSRDRLDAEAYLQLHVAAAPVVAIKAQALVSSANGATLVPTAPDCITVQPQTDSPRVVVRANGPTAFAVTTGQTAPIGVALREEHRRAQPPFRQLSATHGQEQWISLVRGGRLIELALPGASPSVLCGVYMPASPP
jgi:hypothetical protein